CGLRSDACARRPLAEPQQGPMAAKGTCRWLSCHDGSVAVTALKYNFH
uniref:Uncharacterized protein n=1 Tax=Solanum lycopersicum TaxID=4081 RepID=A0A3Q7GPQ2_SOLLC